MSMLRKCMAPRTRRTVVHAVREFLVFLETTDEKDPAVLVECAGDPDGDGDRDGEINAVSGYGFVHSFSFRKTVVSENIEKKENRIGVV
jgi:hypothetical protein